MKGKMQRISHAVNEALFEVALILATGIFRAQQRTLLLPGNGNFSAAGLDSSPKSSVHSMGPVARGEKL